METNIKNYDGSEDVKAFLEKTSLHSALKDHSGAKAAQCLASNHEGKAFKIYMRPTSEDNKDEESIRTELRKEFERNNQD